ncbi:hypothetical protein UCD39_18985 [Nitrospirillum sp. BR 11752]|uniref:hypothetical protein n=1 Tax=Nitrospirillum sp. BR 11752 TaxID=3104293 RepID=UPI002EB8942A|nr:hypothetical protein [Nitrospirillum sp. BR 11752]
MSTGIQPAANRSTHFLFEHKLFTVDGCRFILSKTNDEPVMCMKLGKLDVEVPIEKLYNEFDIQPKSFDGQLLTMAAKGLRYVREIRPGDTIPNELIDGSASWRVDDRHYNVARGRLTVQLVTWLTGGETVVSSPEQLEQVVEDPNTKARVHEAFRMIANRLSLAGDPEEEIGMHIDMLAKELSYIEALRERAQALHLVRQGLETAHRIYKAERLVKEEIVRMQTLSLPPITDLESRFAQVDAQTGEILAMLRKFDQNISYIREMRDDLHQSLLPWDEVLDGWLNVTVEKSPALEALLKRTYHFLAKRYSQATQWRLATRPAPK